MATKNPFADYMKMDYSKMWGDYKTPNFAAPQFDVNQVITMSRRNAEAFSAAGSVVAESVQALSRQQAESVRTNVERVLKTAKDMMVSGSPEINTNKQAELAKSLFETSLNHFREMSEMVTKSMFEASDVISKRAAENMEEMSRLTKAA